MLTRFSLVLLLFFTVTGDGDGKKDGRRGNALYEQERYEEAAAAYRAGLATYAEPSPGPVHAGLLNNLGAALYRQGNFKEAQPTFNQAMAMTASNAGFVRAAYNAGNNATKAENLEGALDFYKKALLADPNNEDAKFNYEYVKRQLDQQQQQSNEQNQDQQQQNQDQQQQDQQNQEQQDQEQQEQDQQQQDQQNQEQQEQQEQEQQEQEQQEQEQEPDPDQISKEEAARILQALENDEEQLLRQVQKMKTRPRRVEKDW